VNVTDNRLPARPRHHTAAWRLLDKVVASKHAKHDAVARAVVVSDLMLDAYISGAQPIPLDRQLCLALFVIETIPALARAGHALRGQVQAAIMFQEGATETHLQPPPSPYL
jgi:hypothetical protein